MLVTLSPIVTLVKLVQLPNAAYPMLVMVKGMITLVRLEERKALVPMQVTGRQLIVAGMVSAPAGPNSR